MRHGVDFFEISPEVSPRIAVFPGDREYRRTVSLDFKKGDNLLLSSVDTTLHLGAHADAASHDDRHGAGVEARPLGPYLGRAQVVDLSWAGQLQRGARIRVSDLGDRPIRAPRVLFKTGSFPDPDRWNSDFCSLSPELVDHLAARGVKLVGIDTPSVDPAEDRILESHAAIARAGMAILEGIVLSHVPEGDYELIALPLRLKDADASPVRAILLPAGRWPAP